MLGQFTIYASNKGLHLLKDDIKFIKDVVSKLSKNDRKGVLLHYVDVWANTMRLEPNEQLKQRHGRFNANQYLLAIRESKI